MAAACGTIFAIAFAQPVGKSHKFSKIQFVIARKDFPPVGCRLLRLLKGRGGGMPTTIAKSAAEYRERAKKLRLAAENTHLTETRHQLLLGAEDYDDLAESHDLTDRQAAE